MAMTTISNVFRCPQSQFPCVKCSKQVSPSNVPFSFARFPRTIPRNYKLVCKAAAGSSSQDSDINPYEVLGVSSLDGFDAIKTAYSRKRKEAERSGDDFTAAKIERAYDKIMMSQLTDRKKGFTHGSFQVSKDIKYADKQPLVPWGPRFSLSSAQDMQINMAISAVFTAWIVIKRSAEWKPLQFLSFVFVYRIFEKLKSAEPSASPTLNVSYTEQLEPFFTSFLYKDIQEMGEDDGRGLRMGKRLLRSLGFVFSCIAISSLGFTGVLNVIELLGRFIPAFLYNNQEMFVTSAAALMLYILASFYR